MSLNYFTQWRTRLAAWIAPKVCEHKWSRARDIAITDIGKVPQGYSSDRVKECGLCGEIRVVKGRVRKGAG